MGRTIPYNLYGQACASFNTGGLTGNCTNSGDTRAASASIYLNSYYYFELSTYQYTLQLHEAGHVFGLGHSYCDDDSIWQILAAYSYGAIYVRWIKIGSTQIIKHAYQYIIWERLS